MGRIKSTFVKTSAKKIYKKAPQEFCENFNKNKEIVENYANIPSSKLKNTIVGYITRLKKQDKVE
ncbi:MAG: 30S ribosomal protein S17e [Nanoarchaeota archaeon]